MAVVVGVVGSRMFLLLEFLEEMWDVDEDDDDEDGDTDNKLFVLFEFILVCTFMNAEVFEQLLAVFELVCRDRVA